MKNVLLYTIFFLAGSVIGTSVFLGVLLAMPDPIESVRTQTVIPVQEVSARALSTQPEQDDVFIRLDVTCGEELLRVTLEPSITPDAYSSSGRSFRCYAEANGEERPAIAEYVCLLFINEAAQKEFWHMSEVDQYFFARQLGKPVQESFKQLQKTTHECFLNADVKLEDVWSPTGTLRGMPEVSEPIITPPQRFYL